MLINALFYPILHNRILTISCSEYEVNYEFKQHYKGVVNDTSI